MEVEKKGLYPIVGDKSRLNRKNRDVNQLHRKKSTFYVFFENRKKQDKHKIYEDLVDQIIKGRVPRRHDIKASYCQQVGWHGVIVCHIRQNIVKKILLMFLLACSNVLSTTEQRSLP